LVSTEDEKFGITHMLPFCSPIVARNSIMVDKYVYLLFTFFGHISIDWLPLNMFFGITRTPTQISKTAACLCYSTNSDSFGASSNQQAGKAALCSHAKFYRWVKTQHVQ
jgi:hypothetical protein